MENNINSDSSTKYIGKEIFFWWEKRRLIYNVFIIGFTIVLLYNFWEYPMRSIIGGDQIIINTIIFIFGANLLYTSGWVIEIAIHFLFNFKGFSLGLKWFFFISGTLLSLIWTNYYFVIMFDVLFAE